MAPTRRDFAAGLAAAAMGAAWPANLSARVRVADPVVALRTIESAAGGRLGAYVLDTGGGRSFGWRADERFCHCSTFKLSLVAMALHEADHGRLDLAEPLLFDRSDLVAPAPVVEAHLDSGRLPIATLAEASAVVSDNAATNLLLRRLGGPAALTRFWRSIGDGLSRLDDYEPKLNIVPRGTQENSTTPRAMATTVRRILLGDVLAPASRERLLGWMAATTIGKGRIRAALPAGWHGYDRLGTGRLRGTGTKTNDLAMLVPIGRPPIIVAGYFENPIFAESIRPADEAVLRRIGEIAVACAG